VRRQATVLESPPYTDVEEGDVIWVVRVGDLWQRNEAGCKPWWFCDEDLDFSNPEEEPL